MTNQRKKGSPLRNQPKLRALSAPGEGAPRFPRLRAVGGSTGKELDITLDGKRVERLHRVELDLDVNDVNRARLFEFVEVDVDVEASAEQGVMVEVFAQHVVRISPDITRKSMESLGKASGPTLPAALRAAAEMIEQAALDAVRSAQEKAAQEETDGAVQRPSEGSRDGEPGGEGER